MVAEGILGRQRPLSFTGEVGGNDLGQYGAELLGAKQSGGDGVSEVRPGWPREG